MAQKSIREFYAKNLIAKYLPKYLPDFDWQFAGKLVNKSNIDEINLTEVSKGKLVVKPDQLFGKRGKNGLVYIAKDQEDAKNWIEERLGKTVRIVKNEKDKGIEGELTDFLVEPFVEHTSEYYVAIKTDRENDIIYFSTEGGIDVEENWDKVVEIKIPFEMENNSIEAEVKDVLKNINPEITRFISGLYQMFKELNFSYLELNPFVETKNGIIALDCVARLDSTSAYDMDSIWNFGEIKVEFPKQFGTHITKIEEEVEKLDAKTGASLKLSILNKDGRVWLVVAGGGASVIFADTVGDLGFASELGNYGEYSGGPSQDETQAYCELVFQAMFASKAKDKVLIIGGGIANFTDVAATFKGIIKAIQNYAEEFKKQKIKIFVRRAGINDIEGLKLIKSEVNKLNIPIEVNGAEMHMTRVVKNALQVQN